MAATKTAQKRAGLTAASGTRGQAVLTPASVREVTPARGTRKYRPRARQCAHKGCETVFTPSAKHGKFCSDKCRKADARRRKAKIMKAAPKDPTLVVATCLHCGATFFAEQGKDAKYCSPSHRTAAWRQRREAAVQALVDMGMEAQKAGDVLELGGMVKTSRYLRQLGYQYNGRAWVMAVEQGSVFVHSGGGVMNDRDNAQQQRQAIITQLQMTPTEQRYFRRDLDEIETAALEGNPRALEINRRALERALQIMREVIQQQDSDK
jgi:hypothetical protein